LPVVHPWPVFTPAINHTTLTAAPGSASTLAYGAEVGFAEYIYRGGEWSPDAVARN
jgi:hypothetical protein